MREDVAAQIGDDALAERGDEVVARGARKGEDGRNADHDKEIAVDQVQAAFGEAEIDHAPHRKRHDQCGHGRQHQRAEGGQRPAAVAADIGQERGERPQVRAPLRRRAQPNPEFGRRHRAGCRALAPEPSDPAGGRTVNRVHRGRSRVVLGAQIHSGTQFIAIFAPPGCVGPDFAPLRAALAIRWPPANHRNLRLVAAVLS